MEDERRRGQIRILLRFTRRYRRDRPFPFGHAYRVPGRAARAFTSEVAGRLNGEAGPGESLPPSVIPAAWRRDFNAGGKALGDDLGAVTRTSLEKGVELGALASGRLHI
jgi:hypothetical protein